MAEPLEQTGLPGRRVRVHDLDVMIRRLDSLPTFPCVVRRVMQATGQAPAGSGERATAAVHQRAVELIDFDPALAARLLLGDR